MKIVFMGTPEFAAESLVKLISSNNEIVAVYTRAPKPKGRGMKMQNSPVHILAEQNNIPVYSPKTLRTQEAQDELKALNADIIVVAAYGMILPKEVLEMFKYGAVNVHSSILPRWRGAAPIHHAIMAGDDYTGVTIMKMDEGLDTGDIIAISDKVAIDDKTKFRPLHDKLAEMGANLLVSSLNLISLGKAIYTKQQEEGAIYASKITKELEYISWDFSAKEIVRKINSLSEIGARAILNNEEVKIYDAEIFNLEYDGLPGNILKIPEHKKFLLISAGNKTCIKINQVQRQGKKIVSGTDYMNSI